MSNSGSTGSFTECTSFGLFGGHLQIPNYHFKASPIPSLAHGENVDIVFGYRISNKKPVVAKVSPNSLKLEREYYIIKRLYQLNEGSSFLVRPLEYIHLPSGLTVVIYSDEGQSYLEHTRRQSEDSKCSVNCSLSEKSYSEHSYDECKRQRSFKKEYNILAKLNPSQGPIYDLGTFLRFAIKCTDCLEFIHRNNVVHGEIRLSAFQWSGEDNAYVKLWNFGSGTKSLESYLTSEGWRKTANNKESMDMLQSLLIYMSPEQTGRTTYVPDYRTDIYSLGIVFFVLLTGKSPFDGGPLEILNSILSKKVPLIHDIQLDVPEVVARIVEKMTHKSPDERYSSVFGIRADLKECLKRLKLSNDSSLEVIEPFTLAEKDVASVFTLPKTIYGREGTVVELNYIIQRVATEYKSVKQQQHRRDKSISTLTNSGSISDTQSDHLSSSDHDAAGPISNGSPSYCSGFDGSEISSANSRGNSKHGVEIVSLIGPGGIGKSTIFNAVQIVARNHGYVASTKFDSRHKLPYSCILKSLSQLLQQILSETEEDIHAFYTHLKAHLGSQFCKIELLADLVPELKPLLDPSTEEPVDQICLDNVETRIRFHNLFVEVFRALSQWRMVTLFLDDIHLADDPSLELLESMIGSRIKILIFVSYRDQEASECVDKLLANDLLMHHPFRLDGLDFESTVDYICDALHRSGPNRESILPLAEIVYRKTRGNAFYSIQLLLTLEKRKLIFFNWEKSEWDFNLAAIQQVILERDGSGRDAELDVNFIVNRIKELPLDGQRLLKWASFVGDTFSWNTVKYLMLDSSDESDQEDSASVASLTTEAAASSIRSVPYSTVTSTLVPIREFNNQAKDCPSSQLRGPINGLQAALQEGYILPLESDEFKWSHDRYSQAAMELANPRSREKIHLKISQFLLKEPNPDTLLISDHLLKCLTVAKESENKNEYQEVLCDAGNRARSSGAHKMAFSYYQASISLLEDSIWQNDYGKAHHLYTNAVALSWVVGEYDTTENYLESIFKNTTDPLDRIMAYRIQHKYFFSRQMHKEGAQALYRCLDELGIDDYKETYTMEGVQTEYAAVLKKIKDIGGLGKVPSVQFCEEPRLKAIMSVVEELCTTAYWLGNSTEMYFLAIKLTSYSLTIGLSSVTGVALVFMGVCAVECFGQYAFGEELGATGVIIAEKHSSNTEKGRAIYLYSAFLFLWKHHQRDSITLFRQSLRYSLSSGDRIYASFAHLQISAMMLFAGENLADTLIESENSYDDIHAWSSSVDTNILIMSVIRTVKALQGHTFNQTPQEIFDGEDGFNDRHFISESIKKSANPDVPMNYYESIRMLPLVLYGHYDYAIALGYVCGHGIHNHPCHRHTRFGIWLHSMAILEKVQSETVSHEEYEVYMGQVEKNQAMVQDYKDYSAINCAMWYSLVEAERVSVTHPVNLGKAIQLYEQAIDQARQGKWYLELPICHEYLGRFYIRHGLRNSAVGFLKKAIQLYIDIGAYGKAQHMSDRFSELLEDYNDNRTEAHDTGIQTDPFPFIGANSWSTSSISPNNPLNEPFVSETIPPVTTEQTLLTLDILDMASILKSSQVISSEVKFDSLLKSMMSIILENSGADCGAIIVKEEKYGMCAYGSQQNGSMTFDPSRPLADDDSLVSSRIIHHTINTSESIFIHNVAHDARFATGPWYDRVGDKSVICMPIIHKTALAGCLFLEGSSGIFTQRHITVLSLLCQQMGISITNAFLFKSVQRVTMANMRMIEMQKKALEDARKSKEAAVRATRLREIFLANMSHEIRTPFSGFYGMISLLSETELNPEQRDLVKTAKESCEILLQIIDDLLNFSKLQAGKVMLDLTPLVVEDLIADVVEMLIPMAIQKSINVAYVVADDVPLLVMADGNRLRQILVNLLGNAIKFTHEGEIRIRCSIDEKESSKTNTDDVVLLFEVIDTGIGISDEQRKVLFEPFSQVDGSTTRKYGGTGLGLSICLQLVELMSGSINVSSEPGKGSDFYFNIRVSKVPSQPGKSLMSHGYFDERKKLLRCISEIKVLAISKYPATIDMIRFILSGIHVDGVHRVDDFMKYVTATRYDVIIVSLYTNPESSSDIHLSSWIEKASEVNKDGLIIIMNYPAGGIMNGRPGMIEHVSNKKLGCKAIRMAVPLRRIKLLRTIGEVLNKKLPSPTTDNLQTNSVQLITDEEREKFSKMNILIAEDNPVAQKLLLKQLTRLGFQVECANNGLEAINAWTNCPEGYFTMAFFDHHMPKCDGVAATKRIREIEKVEGRKTKIPIVALTADVQESAKQICMNAGMNGYLTKPLNQKGLAESLRTYCKP